LVACGFTQIQGIDSGETLLLVVKIASLRTMITLVATHNFHIHQMDMKMAFLNGTLNEEIYMSQLEGFFHPYHPEKVCRLFKTFYGLKKSSQM
jgi:hypothetical protein